MATSCSKSASELQYLLKVWRLFAQDQIPGRFMVSSAAKTTAPCTTADQAAPGAMKSASSRGMAGADASRSKCL